MRGRTAAGYQDDGNSEFSPTNARKGGANLANQTFGQRTGTKVGGANLVQGSEQLVEEDEPPRRKPKSNKTVRWAAPELLENVKYFKMNDEPNKAGLSIAEVQEI